MRVVSLFLTATLIVSLTLVIASCAKPQDEPTPAAPATKAKPPETKSAATAPAESAASEEVGEPTSEDTPEGIASEAGVPLYEGLKPGECSPDGKATKAMFTSDGAYEDIKKWYVEKLADWTNNGFDLGPFGGNGWEFTSPDKTKRLLIEQESGKPVEITITVGLEPESEDAGSAPSAESKTE